MEVAGVDLREVALKIQEAVDRIEVECARGGPRCNEENVKTAIEEILWRDVWSRLGVEKPVYERPLGSDTWARSYKRVDAFYGLAIFEYKKPSVDLARSTRKREEALKQIKEYIRLALEDQEVRGLIEAIRRRGLAPLIFGVVTNSKQVIFIEYNVDSGDLRVNPQAGAYPLDELTLRRIAVAVTASWKKRFTADNLAGDFGYRSALSKRAIKTLYNKLLSPRSSKTLILFEEWRKTMSIAYPRFSEEIKRIANLYGFKGDVEGDKLFFAIQTYYSLVLKLIAAEIASKFYNTSILAYLNHLREIRDPIELKGAFEYVESGRLFTGLGIRGFTERSFFSWYLEEWDKDVERVLREILDKLSEYEVSSVYLDIEAARDMLKVLYEELIPRKEVRQKLGIYSTPDWLAELVIRESDLAEKLSEPCNVRVLDPGCGTGTFLSLVIQEVGRRAKPSEETLKCVTRNIVGFDIEPLAVFTAKTNYLIALAATGLLNYRRDVIKIPIYLANSLIPLELEKEVLGNIDIIKIETSVGEFLIPMRIVREGKVTEFLEDIHDAIDFGLNFDSIVQKYRLSKEELRIVKDFIERILELKKKGINSIWIPVIKSYLAPLAFIEYFDYIVGNPPWLAYRYIADPRYQSIIKSMIKDVYGLVKNEHLITHMELATLFYVRTADKYLKSGGVIGFVMPRSIFSADQHDNFRAGRFNVVSLKFEKIIDCEGVEPLFYVPTCVVIARKGEKTRFPVEGFIVRGKLPEERHKVMPLREALNYLTIESTKFYYNRVGGRSFLGNRKISIKPRRSWYYPRFRQGATLVPQSSWLVDIVDASKPGIVVVQSSKRSRERGKIREYTPPLPVEREFIYGVLTSAEVLPFAHLPPSTAVLPIRPRDKGYEVLTRERALKEGYRLLAGWLEKAETIWSKVRGAKNEKLTLYQRLDYEHLLSRQNPKAKYKVVYLRSAAYLAGCVVRNEPVRVKYGENTVVLNGVIIDATLYRYETDLEDEAYYLAAILNSTILDELIKPLQSKGQFGPRDIHKKPLEFPIPKYDPADENHRRLAELGKKATEKAYKALTGALKSLGYEAKLKERGFLTPQEVGRLRNAIREELNEILNEVDVLVLELLTTNEEEGLLKYLKRGG